VEARVEVSAPPDAASAEERHEEPAVVRADEPVLGEIAARPAEQKEDEQCERRQRRQTRGRRIMGPSFAVG
jgi:hypothetical protein